MRALSRKTANRKSTLRNLVTSVILYERITTTTAKAKEMKPIVEHLINAARPCDLNSRRRLLAYLFDENAVKKVLEVIIPRYKNIPTGFIKTYKVGARKGDGAQMTILELQKEKESVKSSNNIETTGQNITKEEDANEEKRTGRSQRTTKEKSAVK